jgi:peptidoglycan/LPS O-acetylase OafA/YrhL
MVFLSHINVTDASPEFLQRLYKNILYEGYLGVTFFFILSGFILTLNYKQKLIENRITYKEFIVARVARIFPLHIFTLIIAIPFTYKVFFSTPILWIKHY